MLRIATFQNLAWLWDLHKRDLLDLDPPYQRRSIWNQSYKDFFVDTVLHGYPCPAIFLYQSISPDGVTRYSVVDGKQRLLTLFEFAEDEFPVASDATISRLREKYFSDLDDDTKRTFWRYQFAVEYIPSEDEAVINDIFDRINRNVAKLTRQELRHAKFDGVFITRVQELCDWTFSELPRNFPFIQPPSKRQMKDDEFVAQLLLLIEEGPKSYSQDDLDDAFGSRDVSWESEVEVTASYRDTIEKIRDIARADDTLVRSRLRNQADFYSLAGAIYQLSKAGRTLETNRIVGPLRQFVSIVESEQKRGLFPPAASYYAASRSASNDFGPRQTRINTVVKILSGELPIPESER